MRNSHVGETRSTAAAATAARQEAAESIPLAQCYNCHTTATPLWRKDEDGKTVCNACVCLPLPGPARSSR
jgi:GATA-binding protein